MKLKTTRSYIACGESGAFLMEVADGMPAAEAVDMARTLTEGVSTLCERLYDEIDSGDSLIYGCEMRSISFLAGAANALIMSIDKAVRESEQNGQ